MVQLAILFFTALYPAIMIRHVQDQPFWPSYPHKLGRQNLKQILKMTCQNIMSTFNSNVIIAN